MGISMGISGLGSLSAAERGFVPGNDGFKQIVVPFFRQHCVELPCWQETAGGFFKRQKRAVH
jgi:hypothetical protein